MTEEDETVLVDYEKAESEKALAQAYLKLGQAYYEGRFEDPLPELLPLFERITQLKKEKMQQRVCPGCGAKLDVDAVFCGSCGKKIV